MKVNIDEIAKIGTFPIELKDVIVARIKEVNGWCVRAEKDKVKRSKWMQIAYANMINTELPDITEWYENERFNEFTIEAISFSNKITFDSARYERIRCEAVMCVYKMLKNN